MTNAFDIHASPNGRRYISVLLSNGVTVSVFWGNSEKDDGGITSARVMAHVPDEDNPTDLIAVRVPGFTYDCILNNATPEQVVLFMWNATTLRRDTLEFFPSPKESA